MKNPLPRAATNPNFFPSFSVDLRDLRGSVIRLFALRSSPFAVRSSLFKQKRKPTRDGRLFNFQGKNELEDSSPASDFSIDVNSAGTAREAVDDHAACGVIHRAQLVTAKS